MPIHIDKHCRIHPEPKDGTRILVMRYWPRGVRKEMFHAWMRELAPSPDLLRWIMEREKKPTEDVWLKWADKYRAEMVLQSSAIANLRARHDAGEMITLLCGCHDKTRCHRSLLRDLILKGADN